MHIDFKRLLQLKRCNNGIGKHQDSKTHCEAIEAVITLPKTTADVGELVSKAHREERVSARDMLTIKLFSVRYLARQGSALRGDADVESNLIQLLCLRLLKKSRRLRNHCQEALGSIYISHDNQKEMVIMGPQILKKVHGLIQKSPFFAIMVDDATDIHSANCNIYH